MLTSQRDAFFTSLFVIAKNDKNVVLITADCGAPSLDQWRAELPGQFFNCGIAEQGGLSIAAGLALEGKKPYFYAIAPFATLRCLEQIRINMAIMRLPIVVVGIGAGLSYEDSGPTHHALEDLAIMRALPWIVIWNVTDSVMAAKVAEIVYQENLPAYVRLDRQEREAIYNDKDPFEAGITRLTWGAYGSKVDIIATGNMVFEAKELALKYRIGCLDVYRFPIDGPQLSRLISGCEKIVTLEEHFLAGGLGSAVVEALSDAGQTIPKLYRVGIKGDAPYSYTYGGRNLIREDYGIGRVRMEEIFLGLHA